MLRSISTTAAVALLLFTATAHAVDVCGDVNKSKTVTTSDALLVLRDSVGQSVSLQCPSIAGLASCSADLSACRSDCSSSPEPPFEPISVCGTDAPGFKFTLEAVEYIVIETDIRLAGTDTVYALRYPEPVGTSYSIQHYILNPGCYTYEEQSCELNGAVLDICGKYGMAYQDQWAGGGYHLESPTGGSRYSPPRQGGWVHAYISVAEGFLPFPVPGPLLPAVATARTTPKLSAQGWSLLNEAIDPPAPMSYESLRQYLSHVSIREL